MSIILALILLLGDIVAWLSGILNAVAWGSWELASKLTQALPEVLHEAVDVEDVPVLAFIVIIGCLVIRHFRE
jgi:hypothetical protein